MCHWLRTMVCCAVLAFGTAQGAAAQTVSVLDTERGTSTPCGSDRTANLSRPWTTAPWTTGKVYDIRIPMETLITSVDANGDFTLCLSALESALTRAEALGIPSSLTLFSGMPASVVAYGAAQGEATWIYTDPNPNHPGYGIPVTRLAPWSPTAMRAQREIYDAIRRLVVRPASGATTSACYVVDGNQVCRAAPSPVYVSRLKYFVHSPLPGMRYLRTIAGENDPTTVTGYSRPVLKATVKAGYEAARGIAPLQVHEVYEVGDASGSLTSDALSWARAAGDVGIFIENLQPNYPTCTQGHGKIMCEAGLPVVFEMVSPLGANDVVTAMNWGRLLSTDVRDIRIYVNDADLLGGTLKTSVAQRVSRIDTKAREWSRGPSTRGGRRARK